MGRPGDAGSHDGVTGRVRLHRRNKCQTKHIVEREGEWGFGER